MSINYVKKRSGELEPFAPDKLNKWAQWAAGIGVDWSSIALDALRRVTDECTTENLQQALIDACVDRCTTAHLKMAGRLYMGSVYKKLYGSRLNIPTVAEFYEQMSSRGLWSKMDYTTEELDYCQSFIKHDLDMTSTLTEVKQMVGKYALKDITTGRVWETPQFIYMRMALGNMEKMPKDRRMQDVYELYTMLSDKELNPPSPMTTNMGTPNNKYASCCVLTTHDEQPSLSVANYIADMMTAGSAGIGSHFKTRSIYDKVRGGLVVHQGKLHYYKAHQQAVLANTQQGRGGACTMHFNVLDPELEMLLELKCEQTLADKRVKDIDYSVGYNNFFAECAAKNKDWMLVSYAAAPDLYEAFYQSDEFLFKRLYNKVLHDKKIKKTFVKARKVAKRFLTVAVETGREYDHNAQEINRHTPFKEPIYSSNLCQEIAIPTRGFHKMDDLLRGHYFEGVSGEIGLCSLAAISATVSAERYLKVAYYAALMIDNTLEIMDYPFPALEMTAKARRNIGVGITNLAYRMAKEGLKYDSLEGKRFIHRHAELHSYALHRASVRLARERGVCEWMHKTKYADGWVPIDTANREVDKVVGQPLLQDWAGLKRDILKYGVRFSVLESHMPCESSAVASGHTNGLYPIRDYVVIKTSGVVKTTFVAPDLDELRDKYQLAWDISTRDMIDVYAVVQKFSGQAISADEYIRFDYTHRKIGAKKLLEDWLYRVKLGIKTRYYVNSRTGSAAELGAVTEMPESEDSCSACKL